jgi:acetyltransferase-like isoleucine patch superfamily enzyme
MKFLAFLFGWWVYWPYSALVATILRLKGVHVGRNFYIQGVPYLKLAKPGNIIIGDNVAVNGNIDIRNRENGRIVIEDGVRLDTDCRLVAANDAVLTLRKRTRVGCYTIFNCGTDVTVGEDTLLSGFCYVQSSNHGMKRSELIREQSHTYGPISIGRDVWLAAHVAVLAGSTIGDGAVVGANAVVTHDMPAYAICAGVPARVIGQRPE